jgi:hypothetical protein
MLDTAVAKSKEPSKDRPSPGRLRPHVIYFLADFSPRSLSEAHAAYNEETDNRVRLRHR